MVVSVEPDVEVVGTVVSVEFVGIVVKELDVPSVAEVVVGVGVV